MEPDNTTSHIWPPPPKRPPENIRVTKICSPLFGRVADPVVGLFTGGATSFMLTIAGEAIANKIWANKGHYLGSPGHQPLSFSFWCLGLLLTLVIAYTLRRFSELFLMFVASAIGVAILTVNIAFEVLR